VPIQIKPYTEELSESVVEFNQRVSPANVPFQVPETPPPNGWPRHELPPVYREIFLALEDFTVRGAYTLKLQEFFIGGRIRTVGCCQMPISEGIVDRRYALVGVKMFVDALRRQPLAYDLGIGSLNASITRLHRAMGWSFSAIPFFFKVRNGFQFARNMEYLRTSWASRLALDFAAYSGLASMAAKIVDHWVAFRHAPARTLPAAAVIQVPDFGRWTDALWEQCKDHCSIVAVRDSRMLNILYPPEDSRFIRLKIFSDDALIGWVVVLDTQMRDNKYFGNMRVGSVVDCMALPADAGAVMAAAAAFLEKRGVDLVLTNQSHVAWRDACRRCGFIEGPSNFLLGKSKQLSSLLESMDPLSERIHINRGDGDGPIHL
jgi:hypothetical protein